MSGIVVERQRGMDLLRESYFDARRRGGLIDYTWKIRGEKNDMSGKYSIKQSDLDNLFSETVWIERKIATGHRKLQNRITGMVIEYANHAKDIDPGAALRIFHAIQDYLNFMGNEIFAYTTGNWKFQPDYAEAFKRWKALL